jgi:hypothetical protein
VTNAATHTFTLTATWSASEAAAYRLGLGRLSRLRSPLFAAGGTGWGGRRPR